MYSNLPFLLGKKRSNKQTTAHFVLPVNRHIRTKALPKPVPVGGCSSVTVDLPAPGSSAASEPLPALSLSGTDEQMEMYEAVSNIEALSNTETPSNTEASSNTETQSNLETQSNPETLSNTETQSNPETRSNPETQSNPDTRSNPETQINLETESNIDTESKTENHSNNVRQMEVTDLANEGQRLSDVNEEFKVSEDAIIEGENVDLSEQMTVELNENNKSDENGLEKEAPMSKYFCSKCNLTFSGLSWFQKHLEKCELHYQCDICSKILKNLKCLKEHVKMIHGSSFLCAKCDETFPTENKLNKHFKKMHDTEKICPKCKCKSKNIRALRKHLKKNCKGISSSQAEINVGPSQQNHNIVGINSNEDVENNKKKKKATPKKVPKKNTIVIDASRPKLKCKECHKTFETPGGLRKHSKTHNKSKAVDNNILPITFIIDNSGFVGVEQGQFEGVEVEYIEET